jgi:acylphosphatase
VTEEGRLHCIIRGRVQGVAFRAHATRTARGLGLDGWVRNLPDGSVEVVAEGSQQALSRLEAWCHQGSPAAAVSSVETEWLELQGDLGLFAIRYV